MSQTLVNYSINGANPSTVGGTGSSAKYFPNIPGPSIGVANVTPSSTSAAGQLSVPGANALNAQPFSVYAAGTFTVGTGSGSGTVQLKLSANTGTIASPTYTVIAESTAFDTAQADLVAYPWQMKVDLEGDSTSGIVQGTMQFLMDSLVNVSTGALTAGLTGINFANNPPFGLVMSVTFGTSESTNSASMYRFSIEG